MTRYIPKAAGEGARAGIGAWLVHLRHPAAGGVMDFSHDRPLYIGFDQPGLLK